MKKTLIFFMVVSMFFCGPVNFLNFKGVENVKTANATGIPVMDISHIVQTMVKYITQLMEYSEAIETASSNVEQYSQMISDYSQTLREYQHYLNQIESLRGSISNQDWNLLMNLVNSYYGVSTRSLVGTMDANSPSYENDLDTVLRQYGYVPRDPAIVKTDAQSVNAWSPEFDQSVNEDYQAFELYKDRMRLVSVNADRINNRKTQKIPVLINALDNLGPESDLQTLQLIAAQNNLAAQQREHELEMLNQQILYTQNQEAMKAANKAKIRDDEINRLKNKQRTAIPVMNRFGSF